MATEYIISIFLLIVPCILSRDILSPPSTTYDQRQTGKYNIHLNIKDVSIIALEADGLAGAVGDTGGGTYEDYYDYDNGDFTVSPIIALLGSLANNKTTTSKPSTDKPGNFSKPTMFTNTETNTTKLPIPTKVPSVVIITEKPVINTNNVTSNISAMPNMDEMMIYQIDANKPTIIEQENEIPVHIIMEPLLMPKPQHQPINSSTRRQIAQPSSMLLRNKPNLSNFRSSSKIKCNNGQYRDRLGKCRSRRSGLHRLIELLSSLRPTE